MQVENIKGSYYILSYIKRSSFWRQVLKYIVIFLICYQEQHRLCLRLERLWWWSQKTSIFQNPQEELGGRDIENTWIWLQSQHCDPGSAEEKGRWEVSTAEALLWHVLSSLSIFRRFTAKAVTMFYGSAWTRGRATFKVWEAGRSRDSDVFLRKLCPEDKLETSPDWTLRNYPVEWVGPDTQKNG